MAVTGTPTAGDKVRYQLDRFLSWSPAARFVGLFVLIDERGQVGAVVAHRWTTEPR